MQAPPPPPATKTATRAGEPPPRPAEPAPSLAPPPPRAPQSPYEMVVHARRPSPTWTQDRSFTSTRFWLLDPGNFEYETWLRTRVYREVNGMRPPTEVLWQHEIEIGVWPHVQIDLYENLDINVGDDGVRRLTHEGNQVEARIAIPSYYGEIFANPVIYLEWHPRHGDPDRAEARLLLGGELTDGIYLAVNPYVETNVEKTNQNSASVDPTTGKASLTTTQKFIADAEVGSTVAAGFRVTDQLRLSAEIKVGGDMLGDEGNKLHFIWYAGPGFILKPLPEEYRKFLKIMFTCLFALPGTADASQQIEPLLIIGSQF